MMALNDTITIRVSEAGVTKTETIEYSGPDFFFIEELAGLWLKTIREIFKHGIDDGLFIQYLWSGKDELGFSSRVFIPLSMANLVAFAKDANAEVQVSWPGKNEILTATLNDIVVTTPTVLAMEDDYPEEFKRVVRTEKARSAQTCQPTKKADETGRTFYRLEWLAAERGKTVDDLLHWALSGKLVLSRRFDGDTPTIWAIRQKNDPSKYVGWASIPQDSVELFFLGKAKIGRFVAEDGRVFETGAVRHSSGRCTLPLVESPIDVQRSELVVLAAEWERFKAEHHELLGIGVDQGESAAGGEPPTNKGGRRQSPLRQVVKAEYPYLSQGPNHKIGVDAFVDHLVWLLGQEDSKDKKLAKRASFANEKIKPVKGKGATLRIVPQKKQSKPYYTRKDLQDVIRLVSSEIQTQESKKVS